MKLHIQQQGQGAPLVLLHGWGFNHAIWHHTVEQWAQEWTVYQVDLPGHGRSAVAPYQLTEILPQLSRHLPSDAVWCGWSLGGLLAMAMARWQPEKVRALVLFATSPRFVTAEDWPHAMTPQVLNQFADNLSQDIAGTLQRFLALQVRGLETPRQQLRQLQHLIGQAGHAQVESLHDSLELLINTDLRPELRHIHCPAWLCLGGYDALVPMKVRHDLGHWWPKLRTVCIKPAAHIPFLSHPEIVQPLLQKFLSEVA